MELAEVTKERDYYFEKLLDIEQVCQEEEHKASPLTERIFKILEQEAEEVTPNNIVNMAERSLSLQ
jgi:Fe2+ or Zn2+ uptake regulation protein